MHSIRLSVVAVSVAVASTAGLAQKTREQVKAEFLEARRTGDLVVGESSLRLNELYPDQYPGAAREPGKSRAQVRAEYEEAVRTGDIAYGQSGLKLNEQFPHLYPARVTLAGKTRKQVKAELAEAQLLGDVASGESSQTLAELFPDRYAAARAQHAARNEPSTIEQTARK